MHTSMSLRYEPSTVPLHISARYLFLFIVVFLRPGCATVSFERIWHIKTSTSQKSHPELRVYHAYVLNYYSYVPYYYSDLPCDHSYLLLRVEDLRVECMGLGLRGRG